MRERKQQADAEWQLPRSSELVKEHASFSRGESDRTVGGSTSRLAFNVQHADLTTDQWTRRVSVNNQSEWSVCVTWLGGKSAVMHGKIRLVRRPMGVRRIWRGPMKRLDSSQVIVWDYVRESSERKPRNAWWYPGHLTRCPCFTWLLKWSRDTELLLALLVSSHQLIQERGNKRRQQISNNRNDSWKNNVSSNAPNLPCETLTLHLTSWKLS